MTGLTISNVILWCVQISTIVVVVALARQVGLLHLRLRPLGAGRTEDGPPIGARFDLSAAASLGGGQIPVVVPGYLSLITFVNPGCSTCSPTLDAVKRLRAVERDVRFIVAVDGEERQGIKYVQSYGLMNVIDPGSIGILDSRSRPFVVVLRHDGTVLASGVPNTLEQLEVLLAEARHMTSAVNRSGETGGHSSPADGDSEIEMTELTLIDSAGAARGSDDHAG
jgi:methylamine dehydrogenase accessory protein MauD